MAIENIRVKVKIQKNKPKVEAQAPEPLDQPTSPANKRLNGMFNKSMTLGLKAGLSKLMNKHLPTKGGVSASIDNLIKNKDIMRKLKPSMTMESLDVIMPNKPTTNNSA